MKLTIKSINKEIITGNDGKKRQVTWYDNGTIEYMNMTNGQPKGASYTIRKQPKWTTKELF